MIRQIFNLLFKLFVLYLMYPLHVIILILVQTNIPKILFYKEPFIHISMIVVTLGAVVSLKTASKTPLLWSVLWVSFSGALFVHQGYVGVFIAFFLLTSAINYIYRNKVTEPLLVFLPIISGSLLLVHPVYSTYFGVWATYETGINAFADSTFYELTLRALLQSAIVIPIMAAYYLGNHSYIKLYPIIKRLNPNKGN